jgi:putative tryptophan/tyrosine transport system substrate-binding protein
VGRRPILTLCDIGQIEMPQCNTPPRPEGVLPFDMRRREFITLLGGVALAWPLVAQAERIRRIGVLSPYPADDPEVMDRIVAFRQGMQERGWSEGRNLQIDYRWAGADPARIRSYAAELAGEPPDVIIAIASPSVAALRQATKTIPIVFVGIGDPVGQGFVASLARPGGNVTGFTGYEFSIGEKWLGFVKGLAPGVTRVAFLFHPELGPFHSHWQNSVEAAAATLGVETTAAPVRATADVERVISAIAAAPNGGMVVEPDAYTHANRRLIIELAAQYRLPAIYAYRQEASEGGLVSYGPDMRDLYRRSAAYVDRILKGDKPADLPVHEPLKYELAINLKTAKALGLTVPAMLLATADEVIE